MEKMVLRGASCLIAGWLMMQMLSGGERLTEALLYLETGRRFTVGVQIPEQPEAPPPVPEPVWTEGPEPGESEAPPETQAVFSRADEQAVQVNAFCDYPYHIPSLLRQPLQWQLRGTEPTVLVLHTHTTESYQNTEGYREADPYRCRDAHYNMVSVGEELCRVLREGGIGAIHDTTVHDEPSYNRAYDGARVTAAQYLQEYPSVRLVLDLHRDAAEDSRGAQVAFTAQVEGQDTAQLMLVVGTDGGGLYHPKWEENLALAVKLHARLEQMAPGICRPICFRDQRFNQDLSSGALLIEVGSAGNTRQQALRSARILGEAILALSEGAVYQESADER